MKELYISPVLNVICFAPVERLANGDDPLNVELLMDITTYANSSSVEVEDEDFGVEIP